MKALMALLAIAPALLAAGCSAPPGNAGLDRVDREIELRTGHALPAAFSAEGIQLPPWIGLEDGIGEEEAVALALWNNKDFQAALAELGLARADLVESGLLANPVFSILFPLGPKQMEFAARLPVEFLWLRPRRIVIAELDLERIAATLVQDGLNLVRDVKLAMAEAALAKTRLRLAGELAALKDRMAELAAGRLKAGDAGEQEAAAGRLDALLAQENRRLAEKELRLKKERVTTLLGFGLENNASHEFNFKEPEDSPAAPVLAGLLDGAYLLRPDLRAAELALEVAQKRAGLARWEIMQLSAIADANENRGQDLEIGPGLEVPVPLFNQGQGRAARAKAEALRAARRHAALKENIALEVKTALEEYEFERVDLARWRERILPELEGSHRRILAAHESGEVPLLEVLKAGERLLEGRRREAAILANLAIGRAELERSAGCRLDLLPEQHPSVSAANLEKK